MNLKTQDSSKDGLVTYNKNILLSIINLAAKEISGVASLCANFGGSIFKRLFSNNYYEGVHISNTKEGMIVDVYLNIYSNYKVADVAFRVQENIKNSISSMTNMPVQHINVRVMGVEFVAPDKK